MTVPADIDDEGAGEPRPWPTRRCKALHRGKTVKKVIVAKGKLVNIVVG